MNLRVSGSAALDLAYVASGRLDGFYQKNLNIWDIAAGIILINEAGGVIDHMDINQIKKHKIIASSETISKDLRKFLKTFNCFIENFCYKTAMKKKFTLITTR